MRRHITLLIIIWLTWRNIPNDWNIAAVNHADALLYINFYLPTWLHCTNRQVAQEVAEEVSKRKTDEEAWFQRQEMLQDAEDHRRVLLQDEEQKLVDQRVRSVGARLYIGNLFPNSCKRLLLLNLLENF